jgi:hypothetical protein
MQKFKSVADSDSRAIEVAVAAVASNGGAHALTKPEAVTNLIEQVAYTRYRLRAGVEPELG